MKKLAFLCLICLLLLAACGGDEPAAESETESATSVAQTDQAAKQDPTNTPASEGAAVEKAATATEPAEVEAAPTQTTAPQTEGQAETQATVANCNLDPLNLPKNTAIPELSSADWQLGDGAEAKIQIIEYGDFQ